MSGPSSGIPAAALRHSSRRLRSARSARVAGAAWAASVVFGLAAASAADGATPQFPKGMQSGSTGGSSTVLPVPAQAPPPPPPPPPARPDDPWAGVLFNTSDPWAPGAVPPRGVRRPVGGEQPRLMPPAAPVPPLTAGEKPKPDRVQSLYRQALEHWASGQSEMACGELSRLETSVVSDAEPSSAKRLLKAEEKVIDEVAGHDLEVLLPIARFHFEVYQRYLNENVKGRALVENHSRTMIHDLAILYRQQSGSEGASLVASHLLTTLAELLQRGSQHQAAAALYTQAAELDPRNVVPAIRLAVTYEKYEQYQSAVEWLRKVVALDPQNGEARLRLGVNLGRLHKRVEARKLLSELAVEEGDSWVTPLAIQELARLDERDEALARAEGVLRAGLVRFPESVRMHVQLAAVLDRQGKIREARQLVEKVPSLHPGREEEARFRYNSTAGDGVAVSRTFFEENASSRMRVLADALAKSATAPAEAAQQGPRP